MAYFGGIFFAIWGVGVVRIIFNIPPHIKNIPYIEKCSGN